MYQIDPILKKKLVSATNEVSNFLIPIDEVSEEQAITIIKRYTAAIQKNFLLWMAGSLISSRSIFSRLSVEQNLYVELKNDHTGMLSNFSKHCHSKPDIKDFEYIDEQVLKINNMVNELSGLKNITLMATLENTSISFIPYLAELAKKLGCDKFEYTDVHGEADIEHADQLLKALTDENNLGYNNSEIDIDSTINLTLELLKKCFTPSN